MFFHALVAALNRYDEQYATKEGLIHLVWREHFEKKGGLHARHENSIGMLSIHANSIFHAQHENRILHTQHGNSSLHARHECRFYMP